MEELIMAVIEMVGRDARKPDTARPIEADLSDAPACVHALAAALASSRYSIDLGGFHLVNRQPALITLAPAFAMTEGTEIEDLDGLLATAGPGGRRLDISRSLLLAYDGGGMSALGVTWAGGEVNLVIVEMEDPTEDSLVYAMATPAALFAKLDLVNHKERAADLEALRARFAPAPAPAAPPSRLTAWAGTAPPHPFAQARAQYPQGGVLQSAPTAGGAVVVTRRVAAGTITAALAVRSGGDVKELDWPATADVAALVPVPGRERALVHVGAMDGNLVELDLATGTQRTVLEKVGWSSGFVDPDHLVVLADRELRVYGWNDGALGAPAATLAVPTINNIFVAHGCVIGKTSDYTTTTFQIFRWNGATLDDLGIHAVEPRLFTLHAATVVDGATLVAGVEWNGGAHWFALDAG